MEISELAKKTGVTAKTIRYYEQINLLPPPARKNNSYRDYVEVDISRLKLVNGLRRLDFSLDEIKEVLDLREHQIAPCEVLLTRLEQKRKEIKRRIAELKKLEADLGQLHALGLTFPTDDIEGKNCVCHLVSQVAD